MSKRYPPIYSIIALLTLVIVSAANTNGTALYISSINAKTLATLTSNIASYLGFVLTDGFGYAVCESCYNIERALENKWRNKQNG